MRKALTVVVATIGLGLPMSPLCAAPPPAVVEYDPATGFPDHNGRFSAMIIIIPQAQLTGFDSADGASRQISRVNRAEPGAQLAIKLVFTGLSADSNGNGEVTYDLKVLAPDGQVYAASDYKHLAALRGPISDGRRVYDNRTKVVLMRFEPQDMPGIYTVRAVARDEVTESEVPLVTTIELVSPGAAADVAPAAAPLPAPAKTPQKKHNKNKVQ